MLKQILMNSLSSAYTDNKNFNKAYKTRFADFLKIRNELRRGGLCSLGKRMLNSNPNHCLQCSGLMPVEYPASYFG